MVLLGLAALALIAFALCWWAMRRSLPPLDGDVERRRARRRGDHRTRRARLPVFTAASRADLAYRARVRARAGPLLPDGPVAPVRGGELVGAVRLRGVPARHARAALRLPRRFRGRGRGRRPGRARRHRSYTRGVNAGLARLDAPPWEYLVLRAQPRDWSPEDSVLVVYSMWWQLQYGTLTAEIDRRRLERAAAATATPEAAHELIAFVYAGHSDWDTPNYGNEICSDELRASGARSLPGAAEVRRARPRRRMPSPRRPAATTGRWPASTRSRARAGRQRHASRPGRAGGVVPGAAARDGRFGARHHRRDTAGHARRGRGLERSRGLGFHEQLRRLHRRALRALQRPGLPACAASTSW